MSKYLSRADLESIAAQLVVRYDQKFLSRGPLPSPIDPVKLAQEVLGLRVSYLPLSTDGSILGVACFREAAIQVQQEDGNLSQIYLTGRDIVIDTDLLAKGQVGRHNFTVAHELSHHVLVQSYPEDYQELLRCRTQVLYRKKHRTRDWVEWQADTLGAATIIPVTRLYELMFTFGLGGKLDMLSSFCRPKEYDAFCAIAQCLGVSKKALAIRMKQLGLLERDYLEHPTAPIDVWKGENED